MDLTRFFLYTALAVVTYLMLLQWQEDYPPLVDDGTSSQQVQAPGLSALDGPATTPDLPADTPAAGAPDTPVVAGADVTASGASVSAGTVTINTNTLTLRISLNGGDITYLALPQYLKQIDVPDDPFVILDSNPGRLYVAQSGLIGTNGIDKTGRALYQASASTFTLQESEDELTVDLLAVTGNDVRITKRFHFQRDSYLVDISYIVENNSNANWQGNIYGQIKRDNFDDPSNSGGMKRTYLGFVATAPDDPYIEIKFDDVDDDGPTTIDAMGGWIAFSQHYFVTAWIPQDQSTNRFTIRKNDANQYYGEFTGSAFTVAPGASDTESVHFYAGPKDQYTLETLAPNLELTIDYSFLRFLAVPIYWVLTHIEGVVGNYGFSIILLTLLVKALLYKLSETQYRSMAGMRRLMPKMQQLKESYGDDKMKMQKATMELYKKEKINPFGGCLPMLVQMPVFIALYWVLLESVELRHAPFVFWLHDLSVRDPYFILPLMMGATMYLQTSLSPAPADPMQAKVMKFMPIMMTGLFLMFPAGLVLYWFTNGALGILQQWYITRKIDAAYEAKKAT
jgi:YidC/Oxa1 family membrane protein insertase